MLSFHYHKCLAHTTIYFYFWSVTTGFCTENSWLPHVILNYGLYSWLANSSLLILFLCLDCIFIYFAYHILSVELLLPNGLLFYRACWPCEIKTQAVAPINKGHQLRGMDMKLSAVAVRCFFSSMVSLCIPPPPYSSYLTIFLLPPSYPTLSCQKISIYMKKSSKKFWYPVGSQVTM